MAMKERNFTGSKGFKNLGSTLIIHISLSLVVFVEKTTYNLINLKYQNSFNICHNVKPTFSLMNN